MQSTSLYRQQTKWRLTRKSKKYVLAWRYLLSELSNSSVYNPVQLSRFLPQRLHNNTQKTDYYTSDKNFLQNSQKVGMTEAIKSTQTRQDETRPMENHNNTNCLHSLVQRAITII